MWVEGSTYIFIQYVFPSFIYIMFIFIIYLYYGFLIHFAPHSQLSSPHNILYIATDREKKIAQHAKAKREAEKRRGKGKGWFVLYYGLKSPPAPPRGMNILLWGVGWMEHSKILNLINVHFSLTRCFCLPAMIGFLSPSSYNGLKQHTHTHTQRG